MEIRVLGTFAAAVDGRDAGLGGPRQRAVLARVLAGGGDVVSVEQIVEDVWGPHAIPAPVTSVHAYVSRLRRALGPDAILRRSGGYVLGAVQVDATAFEADAARGRAALARGDDPDAALALESALSRWTGPRPFGGLGDTPFLDPVAARLNEERVAAAELLADAHHRLGRAAEDVPLLERLAAADPLRESLAVRLVTALYAAGRQADALAAFERCRRALAEQLGVDPTPALRRAHAAVLAQEPPGPAAVPVRVLPANLPPRNRAFTGREVQLAELDRALDAQAGRPGAIALAGLGGVGKTELAIELAHRRHREGRLAWWVAAEDPAGTATSLADLAAALGVPHHEREEDVRAALWTELDRNPGWVLVFDNVDDPHLVEPYLPTARHGDVLITSRNPAWRRYARPVVLPPLARDESVAYVLARTGDDDERGADALSELVGDLPLALEQACAYIEQTGMPVPDYVRLFRDRRTSTNVLLRDTGTSGPTVATTWDLAFERLGRRAPRAAAVLEVMAFLASDAVALDLLAPLTEDELDLQDAVAELLRLSLVDRDRNVLRVHRLVQDVVRARLPAPLRRLRLEEAVGLCALTPGGSGTAWVATAAHLIVLAGHGEQLGAAPAGLVDSLAELASRYAARALYPAAIQVLEAALRLVRRQGEWSDRVQEGRLLCQLGEAFDASGRLSEAMDLHRRAVEILDVLLDPDDAGLAHAYNRLGHVLNCADDIDGAIAAHERALVALRKAGRDDRVPTVLTDLGYTLWAAGRLGPAGQALRQARELFEGQGRGGDREWAHATAGLGMVEQDGGRLAAAVALQRTVIEVFTAVCGPDHPDTAQAFDKLGFALRLQGEVAGAVEAHLRAVRLLERVFGPDDSRVAMALTNLGLAEAEAGSAGAAARTQTRAHTIFRTKLGAAHASTLVAARRLAGALAASGQVARAVALLAEVLPVAWEKAAGNPAELVRIAEEAVTVYAAAGDEAAAEHWRERAAAAARGRNRGSAVHGVDVLASAACRCRLQDGCKRIRPRWDGEVVTPAPRGSQHARRPDRSARPPRRPASRHGGAGRAGPAARPQRVERARRALRRAGQTGGRELPAAAGRLRRRRAEHLAAGAGTAGQPARPGPARRLARHHRRPRVPRAAAPRAPRGAGRAGRRRAGGGGARPGGAGRRAGGPARRRRRGGRAEPAPPGARAGAVLPAGAGLHRGVAGGGHPDRQHRAHPRPGPAQPALHAGAGGLRRRPPRARRRRLILAGPGLPRVAAWMHASRGIGAGESPESCSRGR
ncbi:hypothetical protein BJF78_02630 [Pseudonocardia sp. CNS-139]|nr:hypothetical protein BJF78_02630 [Pseudonocardia sp. CNS-139]